MFNTKNRVLKRQTNNDAWMSVYNFVANFETGIFLLNRNEIKIIDPYGKLSLDDFSVVFEKNKRQKLNTLAVIKFPKILNEKQSLIDVAKFLLENSKICEINLVFLPQKMLCVGFYQRIEDRAEIMASALTQGIRIMFS